MSLRVHFTDEDGLLCPYPVCDHCGQPIRDEKFAVAYLGHLGRYKDRTVEVEVLHDVCDRATGTRTGWRPLRELLAQMSNNGTGTHLDPDDARMVG